VSAPWYEVRCCCDPGRILGWLKTGMGPGGQYRTLLIIDGSFTAATYDTNPQPVLCSDTAEILFEQWREKNGHVGWCINSHNQPLEIWRRVPGFRENYHAR